MKFNPTLHTRYEKLCHLDQDHFVFPKKDMFQSANPHIIPHVTHMKLSMSSELGALQNMLIDIVSMLMQNKHKLINLLLYLYLTYQCIYFELKVI